ncbi:hypothetical protein [Kutzneria kofuensis]|uniref:Uncharacterized protein n=1 Tax=Kutzneria kofuensis TaxID=103725 RepID=A0A7W9KHE2_9PSEU|nr:hypothetical protein [Kutzneria kofuensis]MBB5892619.1 hypothetical protein [Kutzneria kofuensis]
MSRIHSRVTEAIHAGMIAGITAQLNQLGQAAGCAPLTWSIRLEDWHISGQAGAEYSDDEAAEALEAWADLLGLTAHSLAVAGTDTYHGLVDGVDIELWGVTDRDAFEQDTAPAEDRP